MKSRMKLWHICALIGLLSWNNLFSQTGIIEGKVYNTEYAPLAYASVYITEMNRGVYSDVNGNFVIKNIPQGKYTLQISHIGYKNFSKIIVIQKDSVYRIEAMMHAAVVETEAFVVSEHYSSSLSSAGAMIEKITPRKILSSGPKLSDALSLVPGVATADFSGGVFKPVIRGLQGQRVLTFVQQVRLENFQESMDHGLGISSWANGGIEIIKGPASLQYGPGAMGGVLFFSDDLPAPIGTGEGFCNLRAFSSSYGFSGVIHYKASFEKFQTGLWLSSDIHKDYTQAELDRVPNSRFYNYSGLWWGQWQMKKHHFRGSYSYFNQHAGLIPEEIETLPADKYQMEMPYQINEQHIASIRHMLILPTIKWQNIIGFTGTIRQEFEDPHHAHEHEHDHTHPHSHEGHDTLDLTDRPAMELLAKQNYYESKLFYHINEKTDITVGLQGSYTDYHNSGREKLFPSTEQWNNGTLCILSHITGKWKNSAGIRYDVNLIRNQDFIFDDSLLVPAGQRIFQAPSFSLGTSFVLNERHSLEAYVSSGYRNPSLSELFSHGIHHGAYRYEIGNRYLKSEYNRELSAGWQFHSDHLLLNVVSFYNIITNYIDIRRIPLTIEGFPVYEFYSTQAIIHGIEGKWEWHPHPFDWLHTGGNYTYMVGQRKDGQYLARMPQNKITHELSIEFITNKKWIKNLQMGGGWTHCFRQGLVAELENPTPAYDLLYVFFKWQIASGKFQPMLNLRVNNLLDEKYVDHLSVLKNIGNYYLPGRNIMVELQIPVHTNFSKKE